MKKTEHAPSTGRPSRRRPAPCDRPQNCPQTPPSYSRRISYSCTRHLRVPPHPPSAHPLLNPRQPTALRLHPEKHTFMCGNPRIYYFHLPALPPRPSSSCCRVTAAAPSTLQTSQTLTFRGPSGYLRGQRLAPWTLTTGLAKLLFSPH